MEKHLITENRPWNEGAYVCGCGLYYDIGPCGFPNDPGKCANCLRNIAYGPLPPGITGGHGFAHDNKGHLRIFKDKAQHDYAMSKYGDNDRNIPNMLINEYKEKVIDKILDKDKFGISKVSKIVFQNQRQKVRKLSSVGYRLLNFIAYFSNNFTELSYKICCLNKESLLISLNILLLLFITFKLCIGFS